MIWLDTIYQFFIYLLCLGQYESFWGHKNEKQDGSVTNKKFVMQTKGKHIPGIQGGEKGERFHNSKNKTLAETAEPQFKKRKQGKL